MIRFNKKHPRIWLSGAHFLNDISSGMLNPIMPFISAKLGISMAIATVVLSISNIAANILQPVFGYFADNIQRRAFIFWGLVMSSIFIPFAPIAPNIKILMLCIILGSIGSSIFHPQALGLITKFSGNENVSTKVGIFIAMGSLGFSCGPIISAFITQYLGLGKIPFISILGLSWAYLMFFMVPNVVEITGKTAHIKFKTAFKNIIANSRLRLLTVISILKTLITTSCSILLPFLWKDLGHTPSYIGIALFLFIAAGAVGSFISGTVEKKLGYKFVLYFSMISTLPLMILFMMTYSAHPILSMIIFGFMGLFTMMATPIIMVTAQGVIPEYKSIIAGIINGFSWGIVAIFMSMAGFWAQAQGIMTVLLIVACIPAVCSPVIKKL